MPKHKLETSTWYKVEIISYAHYYGYVLYTIFIAIYIQSYIQITSSQQFNTTPIPGEKISKWTQYRQYNSTQRYWNDKAAQSRLYLVSNLLCWETFRPHKTISKQVSTLKQCGIASQQQVQLQNVPSKQCHQVSFLERPRTSKHFSV